MVDESLSPPLRQIDTNAQNFTGSSPTDSKLSAEPWEEHGPETQLLRLEMKELQLSLSASQQEAHEAQALSEDLRARLKGTEERNTTVESQLEEVTAIVRDLEAELTAATERATTAEADRDVASERLQQSSVLLTERQQRLDALSSELHASTGMLQAQQRELESLSAELQAAQQQSQHSLSGGDSTPHADANARSEAFSHSPEGSRCSATPPISRQRPDHACSPAKPASGPAASNGELVALWQAVREAQGEAATERSARADASTQVESLRARLKASEAAQDASIGEIAAALVSTSSHDHEGGSVGREAVAVAIRVRELVQKVGALEAQLEKALSATRDAQDTAVEAREDLERERRRSGTVEMALAARQSQLEHWKTKAERASERLAVALDDPAADPSTPRSAGSSSSHLLPPWHNDAARTTGADVGDILSKWRAVSLQQQREKQEVEGQLVAARSALGAMRAQALMLERQVETAEDELESERVSAASREASVRAQLEAAQEQARESKELLRLKDAAVFAAEAAAEEVWAELVGARERICTLEDLLRATETELRAAMGQITAVQANAEALDERLRAAESAQAELAAASDASERLLAALRAVAPHAATSGVAAGTVARLEEAFSLVELVSADAEARAMALAQLGEQCGALESEVEARNGKVAELRDRLSSELELSQGLKSRVTQSAAESESSRSQLHDKVRESSQVAAALASARTEAAAARAECQRLSDALSARERDVHDTHADVERASSAATDLAARLSARNGELSSLRDEVRQLEEALAERSSRVAAAERSAASAARNLEAVVEARARAEAAADSAGGHARSLAARLEEAEGRLATVQEALDKRNQEVRELSSMLKAWEAMRLSKDAQIAALMERCKRYDEDIAEKGRSNEALRRKLLHHPPPSSSSRTPSTATSDQRFGSSSHHAGGGAASSVAGSLASSDGAGGRTRHVHVHMHPSLRSSAQPPSAHESSGFSSGFSGVSGRTSVTSALGRGDFANGADGVRCVARSSLPAAPLLSGRPPHLL